MLTIAFYISGHGFGHAARQQAIIRHLSTAGVHVHVRTPTPPKFFNFPNVTYTDKRYDIGLIQPDSLTVDVPATFAWMDRFLTDQAPFVREEAQFVRQTGINLIVSDMPPIAFEIAESARIPSIACTHFTWDWVYGQYLAEYPQYTPIVNQLRASYNKATLALRMPFAHEFDMFRHIEDIPLVINAPTRTSIQIRTDLDIPAGHKIGLLSMGGMGWGNADISPLRDMQSWTFLVMPDTWEQVSDQAHFRCIPTDYPDYQNLIATADVLVGKAGWSTVAEVIAHRTPMLYTLRDGYSENVLLDKALKTYANCHYVEKSAFESGDWARYLDMLVTRDFAWTDIPTNGAEIAAKRMIEIADGT